MTVEEYGLRCERQLGARVLVISHILFLRNLTISGFTFFFFLVVDRMKENCCSFLENMRSAYKMLLPKC